MYSNIETILGDLQYSEKAIRLIFPLKINWVNKESLDD